MSRAMFKRLEKLEQQRSACEGRNYMLLSEPDEPDDAFAARAEASSLSVSSLAPATSSIASASAAGLFSRAQLP